MEKHVDMMQNVKTEYVLEIIMELIWVHVNKHVMVISINVEIIVVVRKTMAIKVVRVMVNVNQVDVEEIMDGIVKLVYQDVDGKVHGTEVIHVAVVTVKPKFHLHVLNILILIDVFNLSFKIFIVIIKNTINIILFNKIIFLMRRDREIYHSKLMTRTRKIIEDSKRFNKEIDFFINKIETQRSLPPMRINRGEIRKMIENEKIHKQNKIRIENEKKYQQAKKQYENDMHDIMEKLLNVKV